MARYLFRDECGTHYIYRPMSEGGEPAFCPKCGSLLERIFTAPRVIIPQAGMAENDVLGIIARSSSESDKRAVQERYAASNDAESDDLIGETPVVSMEEILQSGIVEAAQSGKHAVEAWRQDWVRPELEGIADG